MVSGADLSTMFDVRGLWYNLTSKTIQGTSYDNGGWHEYKLDAKGIPTTARKLDLVTSPPDPQSVGAYDTKKNAVYFFDYINSGLEQHSMKTGATGSPIALALGKKKKDDADGEIDGYNQNAIVYTGIKKSEIGLLNTIKHQVELYDISTGLMTKELVFPEDVQMESSLNFSYCNNTYWIFNKTSREWSGFKVK
jgi:hypothetical protein